MNDEPASHDPLTHEQRRARRPLAAAPLRRVRDGGRLGGVSAGIARFVGVDVRIVRAVWVVSLLPSFGMTTLGYVLLWLLLPLDEAAATAPAPGTPG